MGNRVGHSVPKDEIKILLANTHFKKKNLMRWYKQFTKSFPDGHMNKDDFFEIYGDLFPSGTNISENIFRSFDLNRDGTITFKELMVTLSLVTEGTKEEKLKWLFNVYDFDGNGKITMDEVQSMADTFDMVMKGQSMKRLSCNESQCEEKKDHISCIFEDVDDDDNGYWTLDEFIKGVEVHPILMKINDNVKTTF